MSPSAQMRAYLNEIEEEAKKIDATDEEQKEKIIELVHKIIDYCSAT